MSAIRWEKKMEKDSAGGREKGRGNREIREVRSRNGGGGMKI